jgi:MFS transporter, SP family, arabinose:H+ symporter
VVRGSAASVGATVDWVANFAIIEIFPALESGIGLAWVLVIFAALCVVAVAFVKGYLPETRHRSVEQIVAEFEREVQSRKLAPAAA